MLAQQTSPSPAKPQWGLFFAFEKLQKNRNSLRYSFARKDCRALGLRSFWGRIIASIFQGAPLPKGAAKGSCGETVVQKGVFGESVSSLLPEGFQDLSGVLRENRKGAEKKRTLQKNAFGQPFLSTTPSPLLWRALKNRGLVSENRNRIRREVARLGALRSELDSRRKSAGSKRFDGQRCRKG